MNKKRILSLFFYCSVFMSCKKIQEIPIIPIGDMEIVEMPIIFHIIHNGEAIGEKGNYSLSTINAALDTLNSIFRNERYPYNSQDIMIHFRLATISPDGVTLPEPGIHRMFKKDTIFSGEGFLDETWVWSSMWDPNQYINVWVAPMNDEASRAILPYTADGENKIEGLDVWTGVNQPTYSSHTEGIAINSTENVHHLLTPNVLAHEMGHFLGLLHIFREDDCLQDNDYCEDTYHYNRANYNENSFSVERIGCDGNVFIADNIMDYPNRKLPPIFTQQQKDRMRNIIQFSPFRNFIISSQKQIYVANTNNKVIIPKGKIVKCLKK